MTSSDADRWRVLIIGSGKSGSRVRRAMQHLAATGRRCDVVSVCDKDPAVRQTLPADVAYFETADQALRDSKPDIVCVCVNESDHHVVLTSIPSLAPTVRLVICEKPLTRTLEEFNDVERVLAGLPITINFVERHSPIVRDLRSWIGDNDARVARMDFQWGKYRFRDRRPTMGILSEISHPMDLVRFLAGEPTRTILSVARASLLASNFTRLAPALPDSAAVTFMLGDVVVTGTSSFLWPARRRQITAVLSTDAGENWYQAVMHFDDTRWDEDRLTIHRLDPEDGGRELVYRSDYSNSDFAEELDQINKVAHFVDESMSLLGPAPSSTVAQLGDARWAQVALHDIEQAAASLPALYFSPVTAIRLP